MLLSEKLDLFLSNRDLLIKNSISCKDGLNKPNIGKANSTILFEENAKLNSQVIGVGELFIGCNSYCNNGGYIRADQGGVFIGRYCSIGRRVSIGAGAHRLSGLSTSPSLKGIKCKPYSIEELKLIKKNKPPEPIVIESDVWIGDGVVILPGVKIGVGSVIGSNSVVTKNVSPYQIVGGIPSSHIGSRFDPEIGIKLLESKWWELSFEQLNAMPLANIVQFLGLPRPDPVSSSTFINIENHGEFR